MFRYDLSCTNKNDITFVSIIIQMFNKGLNVFKKFMVKGYFKFRVSRCLDKFRCLAETFVNVLVAIDFSAGSFLKNFSMVNKSYCEFSLEIAAIDKEVFNLFCFINLNYFLLDFLFKLKTVEIKK